MVTDGAFPLRLRPVSPGGHAGEAGYVLEGFLDGRWFAVPVRPFSGSGESHGERYGVEVMGVRLEVERLSALVEAVHRLLDALAYAGRFPDYALEIPSMGLALPVYLWGAGWRVHEPDGPILEAPDVGTLRQRVADAHGLPAESIAVRILSDEMGWVPPAAAFRPTHGSTPWLPVLQSRSGWRLHLGGERLTAPATGAGGWAMWERAAAWGVHAGWLPREEDLAVEVWGSEAWAALADALSPEAFGLRFYEATQRLRSVLLLVHRLGRRWVAVDEEADRRVVFLGRDLEDLRGRVGEALYAAHRLPDPGMLRIERVPSLKGR